MRSFAAAAIGGLLATLALSRADAAVPESIKPLLGSSLGYLMAQSDLCGWGLNDKIHATFQNDFQQMGMTEAQQTDVWQEAKVRHDGLMALPAKAKAGMKAGICGANMRAQLMHQLGE